MTGPLALVSPLSVSVTPAIASLTTFSLDLRATPSTLKSASLPARAFAGSSTSEPFGATSMKLSCAPVLRLEKTIV